MRRRSRAGGERSKAQRRKTAARKSRIAPKAVRPRRSSAAGQDTDVARLNRERDEAFRQQAATAEVLKVISRSLFDLPKVLNTLVESAARLCEADKALILRPTAKDSSYHSAASYRHTPAFIEMVGAQTFGPDRGGVTGRVLLEGKSVLIADVLADPEYKHRDLARVGDFRTILGVPLLREGIPIGIFLLQRAVVCPFSEKQIMLVETFADQAVIAIENTRLFEAEQQRRRELAESLEQQTATSEVLRVISSSRGELQQVFAAMLANAARICEAKYGLLWLVEADGFRPVAHHGLRALEKGYPVDRVLRPEPDLPLARLARSKQVVHVLDARTEPAYIRGYPPFVPLIDVGGARTLLLVPMLKADVLVGAIAIYRQEVRSFTDKQVELVQNFATQAVIAIENTRLLTELRESLERQTATADVLGIISSSPGELEPVFNAILQNAIRICGAQNATLWLYENGQVRRAARHSGLLAATVPPRPSARAALMRALQTKQIVYLDDYRNDQAYRDGDPFVVPAVDQLSIRTYVAVPMLKEGEPIGVISIYRTEVRPFSEKQIQLIASFAAQAVIAIENARLLNELRESLQQQTGTADVLQAISRSTFDLPTVLSTLVESAARLCRADMAQILLPSKDVHSFYSAASYGHTPEYNEYVKTLTFAPGREGVVGRVLLEHKPVQIADVLADPDYRLREVQRLGGFRTHLGLPLLREGNPIGILIVSRATVQPFDDKHIALLTTFADQAVIAIENTRLFEAEQQRTRELTESLEQQTATSDVLKAISGSPSDLEPVFETMLERAVRICDAKFGNIYRWDGGALHLAAAHNTPPALAEARRRAPVIPTRNPMIDRMLSTKTAIHVIDAAAQRGDTGAAAAFELGGARTVLAVPMFKENELVGSFALYRQEVRPFTDKQIELVTNFAAQAVIAIENARLLTELRQRTDDLSESLEQQTATSKVLEVISRSAFDLQAVFEAVAENSVRLCEADRALIFRFDGELLRLAVAYNTLPEFKKFLEQNPIRLGRHSSSSRAAFERRTIHIPDVWADPEYTYGAKDFEAIHTVLSVPILKGDNLLGVMTIYHLEGIRPFTDKQIALVETFADQAAIAIDNVRLLDELRQRTTELGRSVGELRALGEVSQAVNSTLDLETVLSTIVAKAVQLSGVEAGAIYVFDAARRELRLRATYGMDQALIEALTQQHIGLEESNVARALAQREPLQIADLQEHALTAVNEIILRAGFRALLVAPLLRGEELVGTLVVRRRAPGAFAQSTVDLLKTFAAQSAVAIENARLFQDVETSLKDLRTTQDRLVQTQKLASLGQLTAGIAHEIKNPLNFVNNFSSVSVEMIGELQEALDGMKGDAKTRAEITELTDTLRDNLNKIVQHGKRADSIVKNMLLHSREGSGEHRSVDINLLVDESLNLAYHGARAEKQGFNITLERSFDPAAGDVDVFPQEITRVLLNLISNGFYAATKRKAELGSDGFEPTLVAGTKSLGDRVEIRIRDNGAGIPPNVKDKIFNPFFTTKPAGEGTGLGLSISHDIVVKQHSGSIEVHTQPGEFTEFRIVLPRTAPVVARERTRR